MLTTIKLSSGDLGQESMHVRCDLTQAAAPVMVNYRSEQNSDWEHTQYQCADTRHTIKGLISIGQRLAASAVEINYDDFSCEIEVDQPWSR